MKYLLERVARCSLTRVRPLVSPTQTKRRILALSAVLAVVATVGLWGASIQSGPMPPPFKLPWSVFAIAFLVTECLTFHIEVNKDTHSFNLSELPLVVGFFFASPLAVAGGRLAGYLTYRLLIRRQDPLKLVFNVAQLSAETAVGILVFRALSGGENPLQAAVWVPIVVGVSLADTLSMGAVSAAIRLNGGKVNPKSMCTITGLTAVVNSSLSVVAVTLLWINPAAIAWFGLVALAATIAYRSYSGLRQRYASLELLYDFTRIVGASVRAETVVEQVLDEARRLLRAGRADILLFDERTGAISRHTRHDETDPAPGSDPHHPFQHVPVESVPLWLEVVQNKSAVVVPRHSRSPQECDLLEAIGARDCIVAPLLSDDLVVGTIVVANRLSEVSTFDNDDLQLFVTLANHASVAFTNGRLVEQLRREADERRYEALHDGLTKLANRTLFLEILESVAKDSRVTEPAAIMLMDLNRFKEVNDTLGHHSGDILLQQVADRIQKTMRRQDTLARLGGDEFAILLPHLDSSEEALGAARRIVSALEEPFRLQELSVDIGASIGIAICPKDGTDPSTLLQRADVAMYEAKGSGDPVAIYSAEGDTNSPRRLALAAELREAISAEHLAVHYQPKARASDGAIVGVEALVRWDHGLRGLIPPDDFIPTAEKTGLIQPLTKHVLRTAVDQVAAWRRLDLNLSVAVNLSVRCLMDSDLPEMIYTTLCSAALPPSALTLEITESAVMSDPSKTIAVLEELAAIGVKLSVDDFGTGYSSLSYLQRLPVQELKIDRGFVHKMVRESNAATIVQSMVELGHNLGLHTVAEGVEDVETWELLRKMGCDEIQGYILSRPLSHDALLRWISGFEGTQVLSAVEQDCALVPLPR